MVKRKKDMTKEKFCDIIKEIEKVHDFEMDLYKLCNNFGYDARIEFPTLEHVVVSLLEEVMHCSVDDRIGSDISYFIYELDLGKDWKPDMITKDGEDIDISTPEKLYDWLIEEYGDIE